MNARTAKLIHRVAFKEKYFDLKRLIKDYKAKWNATPRNRRHELREMFKSAL